MVVVAATFTAEPVARSISFWLRKLSINEQIVFAPFNQLAQQLSDPGSLLNQSAACVRIVLVRASDLGNASRNFAEIAALIGNSARNGSPLIVCACPSEDDRLEQELRGIPGLHVLESANLLREYSVNEVFDGRMDVLASVPYSEEYYAALGTALARKIFSLAFNPLKALAVDGDGTLWDGIVGEDGPAGIRLHAAHIALQQRLVSLRRAGVLLCLCTKNSGEDIRSVFDANPGMPLQLNDFVRVEANWRPKAVNVADWLNTLGFSPSAVAFLDDNPLECAAIQKALPGLTVLQLPADFENFVKNCWLLERTQVTEEDGSRTNFYRQEASRRSALAGASTYLEFLDALELDISIEKAAPEDLDRISQLARRTTQFNINPTPRSVSDLRLLLRDRDLFKVCVRDRFGDYGLVGVFTAALAGTVICCEDFLLSCRALGRGVEYAMARFLGSHAEHFCARTVLFKWRQTDRNTPAMDFLAVTGDAPTAAALASMTVPERLWTGPERPLQRNLSSQSASAIDWNEFALSQATASGVLAAMRQGGGSITHTSEGDDIEAAMVDIWADVFGRHTVSPAEDFFDLGGNSLTAVQIASRVERRFRLRLDVECVFGAGTAGAMAALVRNEQEPRQEAVTGS